MGVHWFYGTVATLLTTLSGLLPDLDSPSGVELKGFTGILGVLAALAVWEAVGQGPAAADLRGPPLVDGPGVRRWSATGSAGCSPGWPSTGGSATACRPAASGAWRPTSIIRATYHGLRVLMALAVMVGFFSHLLLDEICSVDLKGARVNKAFGTAIKLWAPSPWTTLGMYGLLSYLAWLAIQRWPDDPSAFDLPAARTCRSSSTRAATRRQDPGRR